MALLSLHKNNSTIALTYPLELPVSHLAEYYLIFSPLPLVILPYFWILISDNYFKVSFTPPLNAFLQGSLLHDRHE